MNIHTQSVGATRYVGERTPRKEDARLLTGHGQFADDVRLPGMHHIVFVRSAVARGRIAAIDLAIARDMPGVQAIYTQQDLAAVPVQMLSFFFTPIESPVTLLADGRVACVGDPIAMVIAETRAQAEDAAAMIEVTIEEETPVITIDDAKTGPLVHPDRDDNIAAEMGDEDMLEQIQPLLDAAPHVVTQRVVHQRIAQSPMEARACVASPEGSGEMTVWMSCQSPHLAARYVSTAIGLPQESIRVIAKDVGGGFGLKNIPWREEVATVVAARLFGRPVKWIEDRFEALTASSHAREQDVTLTAGFDAEGKLLAAWGDYACNNGAWPMGEDANIAVHMFLWSAYKLQAYGFITRGWYTNTMGLGGYRGPWAMESLVRETLLDKAARKIGIDPVELRRRNLVTLADQPRTTSMGIELTDITPAECLEKLIASIDLAAFRKEQAEARKQGRFLGIGFAAYIEPTGSAGAMQPMTGETVHLRIEPTGKVVAMLSTHSQGHGTATTMAQVIAEQLGVDYDDISVFEGDSAIGAFSPGAAGSRQGVIAGGATWRASQMLADKVRQVAAHLSNASVDAVSIVNGMVHVEGAPEMSRSLKEIAEIAYGEPARLPEGMASGLEAQFRYQPPPMTFTSAAHCCEVEVDAETGFVKIRRWISAEDCGTVINPGVVEGQIAGGLAQAIGQVLLEEMPYDARGNPLAATFKDYLMPTISDVPDFEYIHANTPSQTIGGMRGVGEGGAIIGPPTLVNAIADALAPFGEIEELRLPLTPARILDVIEQRDVSGHSVQETVVPPVAPPSPAAAPDAPVADAGAAPVAAAGPDGTWEMTLKSAMATQDMTVAFRTDPDGSIAGLFSSPEGSQEFTGGSYDAGRLRFELKVEKPMKITLKYDLQVSEDTITGKCKMGMFGTAKVTGTRKQ